MRGGPCPRWPPDGLPNSQMIPTDPVLGAAVPVYDELTDAYGRVKKLLPTACGQVDPLPARAEERFGGSAHPQHPGRGRHTAHAGGYAPRPRGVGRNRQSRRSATPRSHQTGSRFAGPRNAGRGRGMPLRPKGTRESFFHGADAGGSGEGVGLAGLQPRLGGGAVGAGGPGLSERQVGRGSCSLRI